jgi:hypothetical protein
MVLPAPGGSHRPQNGDQLAAHRLPVSIQRVAHQSGTRAGRARHKKGNKYPGAITGETAVAAGKTATREGARYRKLARTRGKGKAQVTLGNT